MIHHGIHRAQLPEFFGITITWNHPYSLKKWPQMLFCAGFSMRITPEENFQE